MIIDAQTRIPRSGTIGTNGVLKGLTNLGSDRWENQIFESDNNNSSCRMALPLKIIQCRYYFNVDHFNMRSKTNKDIVKNKAITL